MKDWSIVEMGERRVYSDEEGTRVYQKALVKWADGTVKWMTVHKCARCGQYMRPGSVNEGEGYHIDGCW